MRHHDRHTNSLSLGNANSKVLLTNYIKTMRKIYSFLAVALIALNASADDGIKLTFSGATATATASDITVNVAATDGSSISTDGVTAELASTSITTFQTANACESGNILAPVNSTGGYANEQNSTITYTLKIDGLNTPLSSFYKVGLGICGLNSSGAYQSSMDRTWEITVTYGETSDAVSTAFGETTTVNLTNVVTSDVNYQNHVVTSSTDISSTSPLYIKIELKKTDSNGCFAGLQDVEIICATADYTALNAALESAKAVAFGSKLGEYTETGKETFESALEAANNIDQTKTDVSYQTTIDEATTALTSAINALNIIMPADGTFLRLKNIKTNAYLTAPSTVGDVSSNLTASSATGSDASSIWYYYKGDGTTSDPGYLLSYQAGFYLSGTGTTLTNDISSNYTANTGLAFQKSVNYPSKYQVYVPKGGYWQVGSATDGGDINRLNQSGHTEEAQTDQYCWTLEEVTELPVTMNVVGGASYATLCLPVPVQVNVQANNATLSSDKSYLSLTAMTDNQIPANTPAVLISSEATTGATATILSTAPSDTYTSVLTGSNIATTSWSTDHADDFTLGQDSNTPGFYKWDGTTLGPNRAYLPASSVSAGVRGLAFHFGDETTGINTAATPNASSGKVYDLQGRRVMNAQKGLYIVGGKKVLVK